VMQVGSRRLQTEAELALKLWPRQDPGSDVFRYVPAGVCYSRSRGGGAM
jgi:hypothetical protein